MLRRRGKEALFLPFYIVLVMALLLILFAIVSEQKRYLQAQLQHKVDQVTTHLELEMEFLRQKNGVVLDLFSRDQLTIDGIIQRNNTLLTQHLLPQFNVLHDNFGVSQLALFDRQYTRLITLTDSVAQRREEGDLLIPQSQQRKLLTGGLVLEPRGQAVYLSVTPVFNGEEIVGYIETSQPLSLFTRGIYSRLASKAVPLYDKKLIDEQAWSRDRSRFAEAVGWDEYGHYIPDIGQQESIPMALLDQLEGGEGDKLLHYDLYEQSLVGKFIPIIDINGQRLGGFLIYSDITHLEQRTLLRTVWFIAILVLVSGFLATIFYNAMKRVEQRRFEQNKELLQVNRLLTAAQDIAHFGSWQYDFRNNRISCTDETKRILGLDQKRDLMVIRDILQHVPEEDHKRFEPFFSTDIHSAKKRHLVHRVKSDGGEIRTIIQHAHLMRDKTGSAKRLVATVHDITDYMRADALQRRMAYIFEHAWNELYLFDGNSLKFVDASDGAQRNLGYNVGELRGLTAYEVMPEFDQQAFKVMLQGMVYRRESQFTTETLFQRRDGSCYPIELRLQLIEEGDTPLYLAIVQDISERKRYITELEHKALYDPLTDLPNRILFTDRLRHAIKHAQRESDYLSVMVIDIAYLKEVNNILGFEAGDKLLRELSNKFLGLVRDSDTFANLHGGEFVLLLPRTNAYQSLNVVKKIRDMVREPFFSDEVPVRVEVNIGIAEYPTHGQSHNELLQRAEIALGLAKGEIKGYAIYDIGSDTYSKDHLHLKSELYKGVEQKEFVLYYQPQVEFRSKVITGFEALARWPHPERGLISPAVFIPLIEDSGMITQFTLWVIDQAARQIRLLREVGFRVNVSVNISARCLFDENLPVRISNIVSSTGIDPTDLVLEITETALMSRPEQSLSVLRELDGRGFFISIDDYGTGYSSLSYLKNLPVKELKIDQAFIRRVVENPYDTTIVRSTIDMAHDLGLKVVAEGVETLEQFGFVASLGGDIAQGYYLNRPMPEEEIIPWCYEFYKKNSMESLLPKGDSKIVALHTKQN